MIYKRIKFIVLWADIAIYSIQNNKETYEKFEYKNKIIRTSGKENNFINIDVFRYRDRFTFEYDFYYLDELPIESMIIHSLVEEYKDSKNFTQEINEIDETEFILRYGKLSTLKNELIEKFVETFYYDIKSKT